MTSDTPIGPIALPDTRARRIVENLLEGSGVTLNGDAPQDIRVLHPDVFSRILHQGWILYSVWGASSLSSDADSFTRCVQRLVSRKWYRKRVDLPARCSGRHSV